MRTDDIAYSTDWDRHTYNITYNDMEKCAKANYIPVNVVKDFLMNKYDILYCGKYEQWIRSKDKEKVYRGSEIISNFNSLTWKGHETVLSDLLEEVGHNPRDIVRIETNYYDRYTCE